MSLTVDGVWKAGVWAPTVWADGVWSEGGVAPAEEVRGTPTVNLRGYSWHPPSETEEERAERIRRAHIRLGIEEEQKVSAAQVPAKATSRTRIAAADSRAARLVEPAPSVEDAARATPAAAETELSPEEIEELGRLVRLDMQRRYNAALAAILLSAAVH